MVHVAVELRDGTRLEQTMEAPRGSEQKFASESDVVDKFRKLARRVLAEAQIERIVELVLGVEMLQDVDALVKTLAK